MRLIPSKTRVATLGLLTAGTTVAALAMATPVAATGPIVGAGGPGAVSGSYLVVLKDTATTSAGTLAGRYGAAVGHTYRHALRGFEARVNEAGARRLAADPAVAYVEQNSIVWGDATQSPTPSWGLDRIDQRNLPLNNSYTFPNTATSVHFYSIDTGVFFGHNDFGVRASTGFDAITPGGTALDCNGHGTHTSSTAGGATFGVAKGVTIHAVRVLDCNGSGSIASVVAGVDWVTGNAIRPAVANMSLGGSPNATLDAAVQASINSGVTYTVSAGNANTNACNQSPARVTAAITVAATDITDQRASFSNRGRCVDLFAPGVGITGAWIGSANETLTISGTSMAAPHVAGAAAIILQAHPTFSPQQVRDQIVADATRGVVGNRGGGSPNLLLFISQSPQT